MAPSRNNNGINLSSTGSSGSSQYGDNNDVFTEPILPWLDRSSPSHTINSSSRPSLLSSNGSDIHIMKRHVPIGAPTIPMNKNKRFWTWHKVWLLLMNSLVRMPT